MMENLKVYKALKKSRTCSTCEFAIVDNEDPPCKGCVGSEKWELNDDLKRELKSLLESDEIVKALKWSGCGFPGGVSKRDFLRRYRTSLAEKDPAHLDIRQRYKG